MSEQMNRETQRRRIGINGFRRDVAAMQELATRKEWQSMREGEWRVVR